MTLNITNLAVARKIFDPDTMFIQASQRGIVRKEMVERWEKELVQADLQTIIQFSDFFPDDREKILIRSG